jgi:hypothetical protein
MLQGLGSWPFAFSSTVNNSSIPNAHYFAVKVENLLFTPKTALPSAQTLPGILRQPMAVNLAPALQPNLHAGIPDCTLQNVTNCLYSPLNKALVLDNNYVMA